MNKRTQLAIKSNSKATQNVSKNIIKNTKNETIKNISDAKKTEQKTQPTQPTQPSSKKNFKSRWINLKVKKKERKKNKRIKKYAKKDQQMRKRAVELSRLPKNPVKRFFAKLHPKYFFKWWFSARGQKAIWKFIAICFLIGVIFIGGLFIYYKKDLDEIRLSQIEISDTTNTYLDRNGVVLWKDVGSNDYRLVVDAENISPYVYQATIAIEDKNFYSHIGVDFLALVRAVFMTLSGRQVQGGSTLTQQLIKQVYFADEASSANRGGIARKIKELILAIELERMYTKDQIITMYLNQSPYGGRRNGIESASRTYFGKSAKDLTLAEAALLAAIPNNPTTYNPYRTSTNERLVARQHKVLDAMVDCGYITKEEAEEAKTVDIIATIKPETSQYADAKAPHFVLEVKKQLEEKYGISVMRAGGWTITTTLDYEAQKIAEAAVEDGARLLYRNGSDNIAMVSVDVETAQVIALVGSRDFNQVSFNIAVDGLLEPGSSIKPILDYGPLFMQREGINYAPGTILVDENIDEIYCASTKGKCSLNNAADEFYGDVSIRFSLGHSLNIPAVKALYLNGIENSLKIAHELGEISYCANQSWYGLSVGIGSGCNVRLVEHANAFGSIARGGVYKPLSYVLEVKNSSGESLYTWSDTEGTRVYDSQIAYMISDVLSDSSARYPAFQAGGSQSYGFVIPGVWTASKTGTTTNNTGYAKDSLMVSYSTSVVAAVWNGNSDGSGVKNDSNYVTRQVIGTYMERVHKEVLANNGKWSYGSKPVRPGGIKTLTVNGVTDIFPSWYNPEQNSGVSSEVLTFNRYNKLLASECTLESYKVDLETKKIYNPVFNNYYYRLDGYNTEQVDTCDYTPPSATVSVSGSNINVLVDTGSMPLSGYTLFIDDEAVENGTPSAKFTTKYKLDGTESSVKLNISDTGGYYFVTDEIKLTPITPPDPSEPSDPTTPESSSDPESDPTIPNTP